uniref:SUEL-type lectin domain-containing protein n=1 Tax=Gadus morhua TaxID=8049 RepID=A0A8C5AGX3_GADMO
CKANINEFKSLLYCQTCPLVHLSYLCCCINESLISPTDQGVVSVLTVFYGRKNRQTCEEAIDKDKLENTECSKTGAFEALANRCNGKKVCEVDKEIFSDPCPETYKYIQTTYTCLPAHHVVACEDSEVKLSCDSGQTIALIGAFYGRTDRTTCIYGVPDGQFNNITCSTPTANQVVTERCKGKSNCNFHAKNSMFGDDPCKGTYKYLELAYMCKCKQRFLQCGFSLLEFSLLAF